MLPITGLFPLDFQSHMSCSCLCSLVCGERWLLVLLILVESLIITDNAKVVESLCRYAYSGISKFSRSGIIFIVQNSTPSFTYLTKIYSDEEIQLLQRHLFINPYNLCSESDVLIHVALKGNCGNLTGATSRTGTVYPSGSPKSTTGF